MNKIYKKMLIITPIILMLFGMGAYAFSTFYNNGEITTFEKEHKKIKEHKKFIIFPKLEVNTFYDDIRIKNKIPYISEEFIAHVISIVIKDVNISDGTINWGYEYLDSNKQKINISFKWNAKFQQKIYKKTYYFNVFKSV